MSDAPDSFDLPPAKRRRLNAIPDDSTILDSINRLVMCCVCWKIPYARNLRQNHCFHILCERCALHILADATVHRQNAKCPLCGKNFNGDQLTLNETIQQIIEELSTVCDHCKQRTLYKHLDEHLQSECANRPAECKYKYLGGCKWQGAYSSLAEHEENCTIRMLSGMELVEAVKAAEEQAAQNSNLVLTRMMDSRRSLFYKDFKMISFLVNNSLHFLSTIFSVNDVRMYLKLESSGANDLTYKLGTLSALQRPFKVEYSIQSLETSSYSIESMVYKYKFTDHSFVSDSKELIFKNPIDLNRILVSGEIHLRLIVSY